ncbi:MAG TPA: DUF1850 domain-containing protein [Usitatibacter sp.]|nr:DUF1850 domain-containing protein [Usitatibacter sp.]
MNVLCIATAAAVVKLAAASFTLAWDHSIEKVRWEEDYRVDGGRLELVEARVKGSAAGMEPPADAVLSGGWWHYRPRERWHAELRLTRSPYARDYEVCIDGSCRSLAEIAPERDGVTRVYPCAP